MYRYGGRKECDEGERGWGVEMSGRRKEEEREKKNNKKRSVEQRAYKKTKKRDAALSQGLRAFCFSLPVDIFAQREKIKCVSSEGKKKQKEKQKENKKKNKKKNKDRSRILASMC